MDDSHRRELSSDMSQFPRGVLWGGIVFALAAVLTCLNCLPPTSVRYHVHSKIVVSQPRLEQLRQLAASDRAAVKRGEHKRVQLLSVKVLDQSAQPGAGESDDEARGQVVLVEVGTLWNTRCTLERHFAWFNRISQVAPEKLVNSKAAQAVRFARWELATAEHYQAQHQFLVAKQPQLPEEVITPEATPPEVATSTRPTFALASYQPEQTGSPATDGAADPSVEAAHLVEVHQAQQQHTANVARARANLVQAELAWQRELERSSGALQIASVPAVLPRSTGLAWWMSASVLVLGMAAGSLAGWLHLRHWLGPRTGRRLTRLSEWTLAFWVVLAVGRFFADALWRDVLVDSPLSALGRLMAGMP